MNKIQILLFSATALFIAGYLIWYFFFNVYEVDYLLEPEKKIYDAGDSVIVTAVGVNAFGNFIKKREVAVDFEILNGNDILTTEKTSVNSLKVLFTEAGSAEIKFNTKYSLKPSVMKFTVGKKNNLGLK